MATVRYYVIGYETSTGRIYGNQYSQSVDLKKAKRYSSLTKARSDVKDKQSATALSGAKNVWKVYGVYSDGGVKPLTNESMSLKRLLEDINIPIKKGDTILVGRFKNKPIKVDKIGKDEHGMPTVNGRGVVKFRIKTEEQLTEMPHLTFGNKHVDLQIEKYPITRAEKDRIMRQLHSDEGITGFSNKYGKMLRFKKTGVSAVPHHSQSDTPSRVQLPAYWEKFAIWEN